MAERSEVGWRDRSTALGAGFALATSLTAVVLALWALVWASAPALSDDPPVAAEKAAVSGNGWTILVLSAVLAVVVALDLVWFRFKQSRGGWTTLIAAVGGVVLSVIGWNLRSRVDFIVSSYPATAQGPALLTAGVIALGASLVAFVVGWLATDERLRPPHGFVAAGAVVGLVAATALVLAAVRMGDDSRNVDASTAAESAVPAVPARLGERRFSVDTPYRIGPGGDGPPAWIATGGAGFLMLRDGGVRAYDSTGDERWHYLRTGPQSVEATGMRVYDGGRTVVVRFASGQRGGLVNYVVALDAVTGRMLWRADDFEARYSMASPTLLRGQSPFMIVEADERRWARIDTRTGRQMWEIDLPDDCPYEAAATANRISYVTMCADGAEAVVKLVSIDAETGNAVTDKEIDRQPIVDDPSTSLDGIWDMALRLKPAARETLALNTGSGWRAVDLSTGGLTAVIGRPEEFLGDPGSDLLTEQPYPAEGIEIRAGADAAVVCEIPDQHWPGRSAAWLGEQVVLLTTPKDIAAFSRTDCAAGARHSPPDGEPVQLLPGPGVLLAVRISDGRAVVDGYGP